MAREELARRGIRDETAKDFRLGYAPHGWDALARFLADKGHATEDAEKVGLLLERRSGGGHYDRFRHRLLFPITDMKGRIVAFSGRILDPPPDEPLESRTEPGAKYVNSPESPLYKKGEILFGLHEGRVAVRREGWLLVCEGNFDLLALHQAGFENAVAPMGTALTESHAKLIKRFADRAVLLFDGDRAG
jgi:DNA primase